MGIKTILVVDDEEMVSAVVEMMLQQLGYEVLTARSAEQALDLFEAHRKRITLVIMDYAMPGTSGIECVRMLRRISEVPVILSSGYGKAIPEAELNLSRIQGMLMKPFDLDQLKAALERVLGESQNAS